MKIAYFGGDMFYSCLNYLIEQDHEILTLYTGERSDDELIYTRHIRKLADAHSIPISRDKPDDDLITALQGDGCEMILSAGYAYKIPNWKSSNGSIQYGVNVHPSLLPQGAGPMSMPLVIMNGLDKTGVTLHELAPGWDTGDIILQEEIQVSREDNHENLLRRSQDVARDLVATFMKNPKDHWENSRPQTRSEGDYWSMPPPETFAIDYTADLETVERKLKTHRFVSKNGNVEYITDITITPQVHNFELGQMLSQIQNTYLVAGKGGLIGFTVITDENPKP